MKLIKAKHVSKRTLIFVEQEGNRDLWLLHFADGITHAILFAHDITLVIVLITWYCLCHLARTCSSSCHCTCHFWLVEQEGNRDLWLLHFADGITHAILFAHDITLAILFAHDITLAIALNTWYCLCHLASTCALVHATAHAITDWYRC